MTATVDPQTKAFWHMLLGRARQRPARKERYRHSCVPLGMVASDVDLFIERI